ncbi:Serine--tRNA ligase, partial [Frankliniella fusca]
MLLQAGCRLARRDVKVRTKALNQESTDVHDDDVCDDFHDDVFDDLHEDDNNIKSFAVPKTKAKKWVPVLPSDLSVQRAAAEHVSLDVFDPLLTEDDVPGAKLSWTDLDQVKKSEMIRWLKCRGACSTGRVEELKERIQNRINSGLSNVIDPSVDDFKWCHNNKEQLSLQRFNGKPPPFLPLQGWGPFPSVDIPKNYNWGHAYVYLVKSSPNWSSAFTSEPGDSDENAFSQEVTDSVGQTNIARKGMRFVNSDHLLQVVDTATQDFYFVKAKVQASMRCRVYFSTVTLSAISGSVREATCNCKQRSLSRCSHIAALLLYITKHTEEKGYE